MKCEWCSKIFDYDSTEELFELEMPTKLYRNFEKKLCLECAIEAIESLEGNIYFEYCEKCGKKFFPSDDKIKFESTHTNDYGVYATIGDISNEILCLDCAIDEYNKK